MKKSIWPALLFFVAAVVLAVTVFLNYQKIRNSRSYLLEKASVSAQQGDYKEALSLLDRAAAARPDGSATDVQILLIKAEYLEEDGQWDEALQTAMRVMKNSRLDTEEYDSSWERIVSVCTRMKAFEKLSMLLDGCEKESIREKYADYFCVAPVILESSGRYSGTLTVHIESGAKGSVFYTVNGEEPDERSFLCSGTVILPPGSYTLKAVFINLYGVRSKTVSESYQISPSNE